VPDGLRVEALATLPDALRGRVLHAWAVALGVARAALSHRHVAALDALVTDWHGQGPTQLPGGVSVRRAAGVLLTDNRS
jgi:tRNA(Ile)-lysidine synthase